VNNELKNEGDDNVTLQNISNAQIYIGKGKPDAGKKPQSVPKHVTIQSLTPPTYFTGREKVLKDIAEALKIHRTAALYGISGLGKSSVAYKFAEIHAENYQHTIFIRADRLAFDANFDKTCALMSLAFDQQDNEESKAVKFKAKIDELCAALPENKRLLVIFDNVDEINRLRKFLPEHPKADTLLTSNFQDIHDLGHRVRIDSLSESDSLLLLYRKAAESYADNFEDPPAEELEAMRQIARLLGFHPFALSIAALYIRNKRKTFKQYLDRLQESQGKILKDEKGEDAYQHGTIYVAFEIPFNAIAPSKKIQAKEKTQVQIVRECLKIASVLAADNMPEEIFRETVSLILPHQAEFIADEDNWDNIYERLSQYGLFERNPSTATFTLHRLFRLFLDDKLKNERQTIEEPLAEILENIFQDFDFTNRTEVERFLPHVGSFLNCLEESFKQNQRAISLNKVSTSKGQLELNLENESTARLCNRFARYYHLNGQYTIAERYYEFFKNICESIKNIDQDIVAASYHNLALLYYSQGKYEKAEPLFIKAKDICEKILGENHPDTAFVYNNLAENYRIQEKYEEAEPLLIKAKDIREKESSQNHSEMATTYNDLALLYDSQGKYEEAELLYIKAKDICEKQLGENHPWTAIKYTNLGAFYYERGKFQEGLELCEKALKIYQNDLPTEHNYIYICKSWIEKIKNSMSKQSE
jgi:tetratricopeptide (TPR) repeat protein